MSALSAALWADCCDGVDGDVAMVRPQLRHGSGCAMPILRAGYAPDGAPDTASDPGEERRTHSVQALLRQPPIESFDRRDAGLAEVDHRLAPPCVDLSIGATPKFRRGISDAARIESDQIEVLGDRAIGERISDIDDQVDRRRTGSTGIHQQRSDATAGCRNSDDGQLRLGPGGIGGVDRNRDARALGRGQVRVGDEPLTAGPHRLRRRRLVAAGGGGGRPGGDADREHGADERRRAGSTFHDTYRHTVTGTAAVADGHT
jgi:hypothetical protein